MESKEYFIKIVENITKYLETKNLPDNLASTIKNETGVDERKAKDIVSNISATIKVIDKNHKDLQKAKKEGKTRREWLQEKLEDTLKQYDKNKIEEYIKTIKESLDRANKEIRIEVFGDNIQSSNTPSNYKHSTIGFKSITNDFQNQIKSNTILEAIITGNEPPSTTSTRQNEIQAIKKYFEEELDSDYDIKIKKAISIATDIAKTKNLLSSQLKDKTPDEIAIIVDKGLTSAKLAYKLANNELNTIDAIEYTIDRNTAILNSAITRTTTKYGGLIGGKIGGWIGSIFGPTGTIAGTSIGRTIGKYAGHKIGSLISQGAKTIASTAKSIAKNTVETIKDIARSFCSIFA